MSWVSAASAIGKLAVGGASLAAVSKVQPGIRTKHLTMTLNVADTQHIRELEAQKELGLLQLAVQKDIADRQLSLQEAQARRFKADIETPVGKAGVGIGGGFLLVIGAVVYFILRRKRRKK